MTPEQRAAACLDIESADGYECVSRLVRDNLKDLIVAAIREAVAAEREACLRICQDAATALLLDRNMFERDDDPRGAFNMENCASVANEIAEAIRSRP